MILAPEFLRDAAIGVWVADSPEGLRPFLKPGCAAALWNREVLPCFQTWIDDLEPECLPRGRLILRPDAVRAAVAQLCASAGMPENAHRNSLVDDISALADIFGDLMNARWMRLRLDVVTTNACHKLHIDAVRARLVCTYRGTGTQYGNAEKAQDPACIVTVPTGAPILLRGTLWPARTDAPFLHRSPPIEGTGEARLVLVLDPIDDPEETV